MYKGIIKEAKDEVMVLKTNVISRSDEHKMYMFKFKRKQVESSLRIGLWTNTTNNVFHTIADVNTTLEFQREWSCRE